MASPQGQLKCVFAMPPRSHSHDVGMELYEVMRTTGAVRRFTGAPLPDDVLTRILDNARFAPSGGNRQGVRVIAVRDVATRGALAGLAGGAARGHAAGGGGERGARRGHSRGGRRIVGAGRSALRGADCQRRVAVEPVASVRS